MRKAFRPYATVAVALMAVSVIAVAPVIATPPDVKVANPDLALSVSPLDEFVHALQEALDNVQTAIGRALVGQTSPLSAAQVVDTVPGDTGGSLKLVHDVDDLQALRGFRGANMPAILDKATDTIRTATNSVHQPKDGRGEPGTHIQQARHPMRAELGGRIGQIEAES
ncbi:hypothetical protein [Mycobacterium sp. 1274761.0]|uniref:hypothetical protein n=1 Tax=Mycobacterium sp. 1274761.0 TaxID=1834077 RepID=UPI00080077DE|nr:hypothetical protein [Mycobacterium sp. 1274761.0]OBK70233.1 hypothetical protein A5651_23000 [Mycobacterium sp. 1274761.0]